MSNLDRTPNSPFASKVLFRELGRFGVNLGVGFIIAILTAVAVSGIYSAVHGTDWF